MAESWTPQASGLLAPVQAKSVIITTNESYAIHETVAEMRERMVALPDMAKGDHVFVTVSPLEGGTALINVRHIVGFVSQEDKATA
jgi:uncharacterized protein GlcG (DUF336 family)